MQLQVLVSTMNQHNDSLIDRMNIKSGAIIINQCDKNEVVEIEVDGNKIKILSFKERGVGLSRNNALMRADADICLFADDDVTYVDNYKEKVLNAFNKNPKADVILFNVPSSNKDRPSCEIVQPHTIRITNCLKYGAYNIAIRREKVHLANISFSLMFGGGAKYSAGEDSLFLSDCLKKGLKIIALPEVIGHVSQESSTWYEGFTDKYFYDKGVFFSCFSRKYSYLMCIQFAVRKYNLYKKEKSMREALTIMFRGVNSIK